MHLLFDESVTWALRPLLLGEHEVATAKYLGWDSMQNGQLLALARDEFDVIITADQSIPYQQHITEADVAIVVLAARRNSLFGSPTKSETRGNHPHPSRTKRGVAMTQRTETSIALEDSVKKQEL